MVVRKVFDKELYAANNDRAIDAVIEELSPDFYAVRNDDLYGPDVVVYVGYKPKYYVEVEVKRVWKSGPFPWTSVQLPERKGKFLNYGKSIEFWILRDDLREAIVVSDTSVDSSKLVEVPNRYIGEGEKFYQIPLEECTYRRLGNAEVEEAT